MYVCMYVCTYVRMYVRMYVCMYVCIYIYCENTLNHVHEHSMWIISNIGKNRCKHTNMFTYQYLCFFFFFWNVTEYDHRVRLCRKSSNTIPNQQHGTTKMLQSWQSNNKRTPPKCILLQLEGKKDKKGLLKCSFADWFTIPSGKLT